MKVSASRSATPGSIEVFYAHSFPDRLPFGAAGETINERVIGTDPVEPNRFAYGGYLVLDSQQVKVACWIRPNT